MACIHLDIRTDNNKCLIGMYPAPVTQANCDTCSEYLGPPRGLGDDVAKVIEATGMKKLAKKFGKCKCGSRRNTLNKLVPRKKGD